MRVEGDLVEPGGLRALGGKRMLGVLTIAQPVERLAVTRRRGELRPPEVELVLPLTQIELGGDPRSRQALAPRRAREEVVATLLTVERATLAAMRIGDGLIGRAQERLALQAMGQSGGVGLARLILTGSAQRMHPLQAEAE